MRSIPDFAGGEATVERPARFAMSRARYVAGAIAFCGALAILGGLSDRAEAATPKKTATTPSRSAPANSAVVYTIKSGETLSSIAANRGVSMQALATVNGINNKNRIIAGAQLLIPARGASGPSAAAAKVTPKNVRMPSDFGSLKSRPSPGQSAPPALKAKAEYQQLRPAFQKAADKYGVSAELLQSLAWQESGWQNKAVSKTGAVGVGQLMPDTVTFVNEALVSKPLNPAVAAQNIEMSAAFFKYLLRETNGDQRLALASYYQGLGSVRRIGLYDDTQQYVRSVVAIQNNWF